MRVSHAGDYYYIKVKFSNEVQMPSVGDSNSILRLSGHFEQPQKAPSLGSSNKPIMSMFLSLKLEIRSIIPQ